MTIRRPISPTLPDPTIDRVVREHARVLNEVLDLPAAAMRVIAGVVLPDATDVAVAHRLGRPPRWHAASSARPGTGLTGGAVLEVRAAGVDPATHLVLRAVGFGATITVDVAVL